MPISKNNQLFSLIKSLTRGEKRHFRSYAQRESEGAGLKYLQLFDLLERQKELNESKILEKFSKVQIPNLKRHLYSQIMVSLRLQKQKINADIQLRELLDFAYILYGKGLYLQSLKIIEKAKAKATKINEELILLKLIEFEKIIETRHITRSGTDRVLQLTDESSELIENVSNRIRLSNLRLSMHGTYIKYGHARSQEETQEIKSAYQKQLEAFDENKLGLIEQAYFYQSKVWYHFILLEMEKCFHYAVLWLSIFKADGIQINRDTNLIMRAYHYILTSLYHLGDQNNYIKYLDEFESFRKSNYNKFNTNSKITSFIYVHNGRLNKYVLTKDYSAGLNAIPRTKVRIKRYDSKLDGHRILVLYYKMALLHLQAGEAGTAISYLYDILNNKVHNLREDIQGYARLVFLMAHYDNKNYDVVGTQVKSVKQFFDKINLGIQLPYRLVQFFKEVSKRAISEHRLLFKELQLDLDALHRNKYEKRGILYIDIMEWVGRHV